MGSSTSPTRHVAPGFTIAFVMLASAGGPWVNTIEEEPSILLVSVGVHNEAANGRSLFPDIDDSGASITFSSFATNLDGRGHGEKGDAFVRDMLNGTTRLASIAPPDAQRTGVVLYTAISGDGSTIAFDTNAGEFAPDDHNGHTDVFVASAHGSPPEMVTRNWRGESVTVESGPACSPGCGQPDLSGDGRFVVITTRAQLTPDDHDENMDVYRRDLDQRTTTRISRAFDGNDTNGDSVAEGVSSISDDGRFIVYESRADNIVHGELPRCGGTTFLSAGTCWQVYVYDALEGNTDIVSVNVAGHPANDASGRPVISGDGSWVFFQSKATNLVADDTDSRHDVYGRNLRTAEVVLVSNGTPRSAEGTAFHPATNQDGSVVAFLTDLPEYGGKDGIHGVVATAPGSGRFSLVSHGVDGEWPNDHIGRASMTADGRIIAFFGFADNLVDRDEFMESDGSDVFVAANPMFDGGAGSLPYRLRPAEPPSQQEMPAMSIPILFAVLLFAVAAGRKP